MIGVPLQTVNRAGRIGGRLRGWRSDSGSLDEGIGAVHAGCLAARSAARRARLSADHTCPMS
ncbi:hypothetical protein RHOFW104R3_16545 [Rhodanobacter denitrificans]|nr:hypothetical protein RHOFW104R3_16545 [Rhodanobacter denitrificans]